MLESSILFKYNYRSTAQVIVNQGGTSSGKTYAIMQVLFCLAAENENQVLTVVGQDIPNLKAGALRDALNIYAQWDSLQSVIRNYNKSDRIFEYYNGSIIEFKSYDNAQDAKSGKRDYLFVNEANGVDWSVFTELSLRTKKRVYIDYNPNTAFWVHDHLMGKPGVQLLISDHRHNPFLGDAMRDKIEMLKTQDEEQWKVYARGLTGKISGLIFSNWVICNDIPADAKLVACGLDFGFSNDETGLIQVYKQDGELWIRELIYQTGLTNTDVSAQMEQLQIGKNIEIIADSAEPKSIEELRRLGWHVTGAKKGADSVKNSIDILKRYKLNITADSINLRNELGRYKWRTDRSGKSLNEPVDSYNHLVDPLRYVALNKLKINRTAAPKSRLPWQAQTWQSEAAKVL